MVKKRQFSVLYVRIRVLRLLRAFSPVLNLQSRRIGVSDISTNSQGWAKTTGASTRLRMGRKRPGGNLRTEEVTVAGIRIILPSILLLGNGGLYAAREESQIKPSSSRSFRYWSGNWRLGALKEKILFSNCLRTFPAFASAILASSWFMRSNRECEYP